MKKLLFAIFALFVINSAFAQLSMNDNYKTRRPLLNNAYVNSLKQAHATQGNSRATFSFNLDYEQSDVEYSDFLGLDPQDYSRFLNSVNRRYKSGPPADTSGNFTVKWAAVKFDTLYNYVDQQSYPLEGSTVTIDSVHFLFNHFNTTGTDDSVIVSILEIANTPSGLLSSNQGITLNNVVLWDTVIVTNTSLTPNLTPLQLAAFSTPVGITLPTGEGYIMFIDFVGDTANKFSLVDGNRDECAGDCGASLAFIPENSFRYFNFYRLPSTQLSGVGDLVLDCDNTNPPGTPESCELFYFQNWGMWSTVTVDIPLSASVAQANLTGCPGTPVALSVNAVGGAPNYDYTWSNGQSGATIQVNVGNTVETFTCTVVDANNDTVTKTVTVTPRGINVSLGNDQTVGCGQTVNLSPTVSGTVQGATYLWSTGASTLNITNVAPGEYELTASNSFGCTSTDNIVVSIAGINQTLNFNLPAIWNRNCPLEITNQSTTTTNWNFTWDFGDGNLSLEVNPTHTWASLATFTVTLTADSSGCELVKTDVVEIRNGTCNIGIDEALLSSINIYPNPSNGRFVVSLDAVAGKNAVINVVNIRGEVVSTEKFIATGKDAKEINLSNVSNGLYLVNIQVDGKLASKTILKN